ncbi:MAG TPA: hypothetical protein VEL28_15115 [Candidatus Binatia bacterium]|nr:hypothetical protein [Candidatus Binatia bacterium]
MKRPFTILASITLAAATAAPAMAEWRWVEEDNRQVYEETQVYEEQQPRYYEEQRYETHYQPVVESREVFRDRDCEVTRTHMSDGTTHDERRCGGGLRVVPPHVFIIDRIGRHFDRLRGY